MTGIAHGADKVVEVLLVEDSSGDIRLTREAFRAASEPISLHVATDGLEAMQFLRREPPFDGVPRPDIILLDLRMPRMDGFAVLAEIKQDASLQSIPTIILTVSSQQADILKGYELNVNCYLNKPIELSAFQSAIRSMTNFWLAKAQLPLRGQRA